MQIDIDTLKELLPGIVDPGGSQHPERTIYLLTLGYRLYICTDYNEIHKFGLHWRQPLIDIYAKTHQDIPLNLFTHDFRELSI